MSISTIRNKRSTIPGKIPTVEQLTLGELAINHADGIAYIRRERVGFPTDIVPIGVGASVLNTLYVSKSGSDSNSGLTPGDTFATIKKAVSVATTSTTIKVFAGDYVEDNPIKLPDQVSIIGSALREVSVTPQNQGDLFLVGNGNYISDMSFTGSSNTGAIGAFDADDLRYITQSPYFRNCTNFIPDSTGLRIDGNHALGPLKSMVVDSFTQNQSGGIGVSITNEAYAQLVSIFNITNGTGIYCGDGGSCDITNSNSSFGDFGLFADGISPLKYTGIVTETASNTSSIVLNLNTPVLNISTASYDNNTGILTAYVDSAHEFSVGMSVFLEDLEFSCPDSPPNLLYPSGNYGNIFEIKTVAPGRYVDAYNLIILNKREIQDKSLAAIALNHPDFFFPGDTQTNSRSRYYDSYRLIQQNKQEIIDIAWNNTVSTYPGISTTQTKCKRDLGYFVDAISTDVFTGGNNYAREFTLQYFDGAGNPISNGLVGEEVESIFAFHEARELMKDAITNQLTIQDLTLTADPLTASNTDPASCADVQSNINNLVGVVTTVIGSGNTSSLPTVNFGTFTDGGSKCFRDIGFIIDAVALDVRDFTNKNVINATEFYFDIFGDPITNGLVGEEQETITAYHAVRDYAKLAITNQLNKKDLSIIADSITGFNTDPSSCSDVRSNIDNLVGIITTSIGNGDLNSLPSVSMASTIFTTNVGISTIPHTYVDGGTVKIDVVRPFDGQVIFLKELYYIVRELQIINPGSGYINTPTITIESSLTTWGIEAQFSANLTGGSLTSFNLISNGRGYSGVPPTVTISSPDVGINTATAIAILEPKYYSVATSTPISSGISTVTLTESIPYDLTPGDSVEFFRQSRIIASSHSFEYVGSGIDLLNALPFRGGVTIQENEVVSKNGGLVVYTSTDQKGDFRIGDQVLIEQSTATISGRAFSQSLLNTVTPLIIALGGD